MPYPMEDNFAYTCIKKFMVPMKVQIKMKATKINSFFSFPGYFLRLSFLLMLKINSFSEDYAKLKVR